MMNYRKLNLTGRGIITVTASILVLAYLMADLSCYLIDLILL